MRNVHGFFGHYPLELMNEQKLLNLNFFVLRKYLKLIKELNFEGVVLNPYSVNGIKVIVINRYFDPYQ